MLFIIKLSFGVDVRQIEILFPWADRGLDFGLAFWLLKVLLGDHEITVMQYDSQNIWGLSGRENIWWVMS